MMIDPRPDDELEPKPTGSLDEDVFADLPAFDVVDGELMPRAPKRGR
ncbi:hypothetical protein MTS1_02252 [Microbacterium sp. TS-1]|jgi:hypothetical protein|nr:MULTISPECIES: hypothetical protein [Microbacterium]GAD34881.1 hypothetical protein MTS1_02252 [Microbacterium sp. TS-1]